MPRKTMPNANLAPMSPRMLQVLFDLIEIHIASGEPVGSRALARVNGEALSSASLRNVLADLEDAGLVSQPHTSAGRVPTDLAYRVYVQHLLRDEAFRTGGARAVRTAAPGGVPDVHLVLKDLARRTSCAALSVAPVTGSLRLDHLEFVRVGPCRVLVVLVSRAGFRHERVVETAADFSVEQLRRMAGYLLDHYGGKPLDHVRQELARMTFLERAALERFTREALAIAEAALAEADRPEGFHVEGTHHLLTGLGTAHLDAMRSLLEALEEKEHLLQILSGLAGNEGLQVLVAPRVQQGELPVSLLFIPMDHEGGLRSGVGLLGPTRLDYRSVMRALVSAAERMRPLMAPAVAPVLPLDAR